MSAAGRGEARRFLPPLARGAPPALHDGVVHLDLLHLAGECRDGARARRLPA